MAVPPPGGGGSALSGFWVLGKPDFVGFLVVHTITGTGFCRYHSEGV